MKKVGIVRIEMTVAGSLPRSAEIGEVHSRCGCADSLRSY